MLTTLLRGLLPIGLLLCGMVIAGGLARGLWRYTINRYLVVVLLLIASPALAELAPYQGSDGRIFPGLAPHWGAYTHREPTPRLGVDNGQANPEYAVNRSDDGGGYGHGGYSGEGRSLGGYADTHGATVAIGGGIRETVQGIRQGEGRAIGGCFCSGAGNYDSVTGGTGTSYK